MQSGFENLRIQATWYKITEQLML